MNKISSKNDTGPLLDGDGKTVNDAEKEEEFDNYSFLYLERKQNDVLILHKDDGIIFSLTVIKKGIKQQQL